MHLSRNIFISLVLIVINLTIIAATENYTTTETLFDLTAISSFEATTEDVDINAKSRKSEILDQLLERGYNNKLRPLGLNGSGPVHISIRIAFRSIENIDDTRMEYTSQILFRQSWLDPRLRYAEIGRGIKYLQLVVPNRIWSPDVFFENEKVGTLHKIVRPNLFTRIYPNGSVLQSFRFSIQLSCPMNLRAYPLDFQMCPLRMASFGYTTKDTTLEWNKDNPIQHGEFNMPQFKILSFDPRVCTSISQSGNYSCVGVEIKIKREFGFFFIQIYLPCAMLVLVSWVSFWLEPTAVEARVSLGVTAILTIVTQIYGINKSVPPASYIKALDIWTAACQFLVFGGLLQFALVNYLTRLSDPLSLITRIRSLTQKSKDKDENTEEAEEVSHEDVLEKCLQRAKRVDRIARIGFPVTFFLFNIAYWTSYGII